MCTEARKMRMKDFLSFGVSELMGMALTKGLIDCTVIVCEGAGTVIVTDPELAQGIGGRISGILETSPIESVIEAVGRERVLDPKTAKIDQVRGVEKAVRPRVPEDRGLRGHRQGRRDHTQNDGRFSRHIRGAHQQGVQERCHQVPEELRHRHGMRFQGSTYSSWPSWMS